MMSFLAHIVTWLNVPLNAAGKLLTAPVAAVPGWLSNTAISAVTGVEVHLQSGRHRPGQR